jgi:hypothetical protein
MPRSAYQQGVLLTPSAPLPLPASPTKSTAPSASSGTHPPLPNTTLIAGRAVRRLTQAEMDEHRRLGQCFNCDEKYVQGHNCTCKHLFLLELSDEAEDDEEQAEALQISLHALTGIKTGETMQVTTRIGNEVFHALLDYGSTHSFIAETAATRFSSVDGSC